MIKRYTNIRLLYFNGYNRVHCQKFLINMHWYVVSINGVFSVTYVHVLVTIIKLVCGPMPNVMVALPNIGGAL